MRFSIRASMAAFSIAAGSLIASATVVTDFDGDWQSGTTGTGTVDLVDLTGLGGNLEANAPLPTGALRLSTTENADRADVVLAQDFGLVSEVLTQGLSLSYSMYKEATSNSTAAPALKLGFFNQAVSDSGEDGFVQLIFEPYWNITGVQDTSTNVPTGDWLDFEISLTSGFFWNTGGFGVASSAGGPPLRTLEDWLGLFDSTFLDASLVSIGFGLGSFNANTVGYVDNFNARLNNSVFMADFEAAGADIPAPAPLALMGFGLAGLALRRRRA